MVEHNKTLAFVFPGQGSQQIGMLQSVAEDFPLIRKTFATASEVLGKDLWHLSQQGPVEDLNNTVNTQPILLTAGVALWRVWQQKNGAMPTLMAGHSMGEYTALVCANAISFEDGVKLVAERGRLMQEAVPKGQGAMAAVLGLDDQILSAVCKEAAQGEVVAAVNFNAIGQTVIAGNTQAVERASALAKEKGAKRVLMLPVSVPSHCDLMYPAAMLFAKVLAQVAMVSPTFPVIHNVDVNSCSHPDDIRARLVQQLYHPVRWVETIQRFSHEGLQTVIECGPGKVLSGLIKRIAPELKTMGIEMTSELVVALENCRARS